MVLRVPEILAERVLEIAQKLDEGGDLRVREEDGVWLIETPRRAVRYDTAKPVNVASVPHRSPFRYPGGKTWLVPQFRCWLLSKTETPMRFVEPFAGGAIASMTAGFAEQGETVSTVWSVALNSGTPRDKELR